MIQHVWERCSQAQGVDRVIVGTEDERIVAGCKAFGGECELTSANHPSGTDRVAEIAARYADFECVLNVQGDEPGIAPDTVSAVVKALQMESVQISTAMSVLDNDPDLQNPNVVKVVTSLSGKALYFSRCPIPYLRDAQTTEKPVYYRHMGIYGFRRSVLFEVTQLPMSPLERAESLEQLRWMQSGYMIQCVNVANFSIGVDTPEDLKSVETAFQA